MVEIFGMEVKVKLIITNLKEVAEQIKKAVQDMTVKVRAQVGGMEAGMRAGLFGVEEGKKTVSSLGLVVGKLAFIGIVLTGIREGIISVKKAMEKTSPLLSGVFQMFENAIMLFIRPFADFLAMMLRPLAIWLLKMAVGFLRWFQVLPKEAKGAMTGAVVGAIGGGAIAGPIGALAGAGVGALVGLLSQVDWQAVGQRLVEFGKWVWDSLSWIVTHPIEAIQALGDMIIKGLTNFGELLSKGWNTFVEWLGKKFGEFGKWLWENLSKLPTWVAENFSKFAGWLGEQIERGLRLLVDWILRFPGWLWDVLTNVFSSGLKMLVGIGQWIWNTITGGLSNIWNWLSGIGQWIWNTITGGLSNIWNWLSGIGQWIWNTITNAILNFLGGGFWRGFTKGQSGISFVPATGLYFLHRGEKVLTSSQSERMFWVATENLGAIARSLKEMPRSGKEKTIIFRPTYTFTGEIKEEVDVDELIRRSHRISELELRRKGWI